MIPSYQSLYFTIVPNLGEFASVCFYNEPLWASCFLLWNETALESALRSEITESKAYYFTGAVYYLYCFLNTNFI